jgi:hypothetical protein
MNEGCAIIILPLAPLPSMVSSALVALLQIAPSNKVKVKLSLCLIKYCVMKTWGVDV